MRYGNRILWVLGCSLIFTAMVATTYAGAAVQVPEMDSASLCVVGITVGGYLVSISKRPRK